jgi:hypothetical protein
VVGRQIGRWEEGQWGLGVLEGVGECHDALSQLFILIVELLLFSKEEEPLFLQILSFEYEDLGQSSFRGKLLPS